MAANGGVGAVGAVGDSCLMSSVAHRHRIRLLPLRWWYHPGMERDSADHSSPQSPFDPYVSQLLTLIASQSDIPMSGLCDLCVRELQWLPGFCDVVVNILRTNGLILSYEWAPGKVHISDRGKRWVHAAQQSVTIS